ncbi:MAG TPA: hypothetical protein VMP00_06855 [Burkholderiales bacterium]|nr:hypothetical protein [Burkholderiales bacterium]
MATPTFLPLLNSIAVNEAKGEILLRTWAEATQDATLEAALRFVAIREGEHAAAFTKRMCELGHAVDESTAYQVFKNFDELVACAGGDASDAEKVAMLTGNQNGEDRGESRDPFRGFFNDTTIDPQTGALLGRYICEERDSGRRLQAEYQRVCGAQNHAPASADLAEMRACIETLQAEVQSLKKAVKQKRAATA